MNKSPHLALAPIPETRGQVAPHMLSSRSGSIEPASRGHLAAHGLCKQYRKGQVIACPIAHGDGNYRCDEATLDRLKAEDRVAFRYVDERGAATVDGNPNGSIDSIAGILNARRNILGMMPHPENLIEPLHGGTDGRPLFAGMVAALGAAA